MGDIFASVIISIHCTGQAHRQHATVMNYSRSPDLQFPSSVNEGAWPNWTLVWREQCMLHINVEHRATGFAWTLAATSYPHGLQVLCRTSPPSASRMSCVKCFQPDHWNVAKSRFNIFDREWQNLCHIPATFNVVLDYHVREAETMTNTWLKDTIPGKRTAWISPHYQLQRADVDARSRGGSGKIRSLFLSSAFHPH